MQILLHREIVTSTQVQTCTFTGMTELQKLAKAKVKK